MICISSFCRAAESQQNQENPSSEGLYIKLQQSSIILANIGFVFILRHLLRLALQRVSSKDGELRLLRDLLPPIFVLLIMASYVFCVTYPLSPCSVFLLIMASYVFCVTYPLSPLNLGSSHNGELRLLRHLLPLALQTVSSHNGELRLILFSVC